MFFQFYNLLLKANQEPSGKSCAPARQNQAEARVDVVGLAAAAPMKDQRCQGATMELGVEDDLAEVEIEKRM